jgi:hypothetical protein
MEATEIKHRDAWETEALLVIAPWALLAVLVPLLALSVP